jgi:Cu-Zn family superoxide dismutase
MLRFSSLACAVLICGGLIATFTRAADAPGEMALANIMPSKAAATQPSNTNVTGTVTFRQSNQDIEVVADITGLSPGKHGIHIHAKDDLSDPKLVSAGPHWDMGGKHHHGGPDTAEHHAGDLGNLTADDSGKAHMAGVIHNMKLDDLKGHSVIIHAGEDDLKTDPAGNSGGRVAGGAIEVKK